ncbi:unnamed protein product [Adineta steineri]|uniref:Uncharacterized protein n=1 Tax=Adineta steineri TaxID=433720 RepID=A0A819KN05_9BILA|nr:unnamed protein product [Adineta steineri]
MITDDYQSAMKMQYLGLIVEFRLSNGNLLFKTTRADLSHRKVQCIHDYELQLDQVITLPMPKNTFKSYWLATEGKQSTINDNSKIISKADLTTDSLDHMKLLTKKQYDLDASKTKTSNLHEVSLLR